VASISLNARSALAGSLTRGRYGASTEGAPGLTIAERTGFAVAHVAARRGAAAGMAERLSAVATPIGLAPDQWLVIADGTRAQRLVAELSSALGDSAAVIDLSCAKTIMRISGPRARDVLAKGCPLDLDGRVFRPGDAATTHVAHIGCTILQVGDEPSYDLIVPRSLASSFLAWLTASAAEYGYEVA